MGMSLNKSSVCVHPVEELSMYKHLTGKPAAQEMWSRRTQRRTLWGMSSESACCLLTPCIWPCQRALATSAKDAVSTCSSRSMIAIVPCKGAEGAP